MIQSLPTLIPSSRVQYSTTVPAPTEMLGRKNGGGGEMEGEGKKEGEREKQKMEEKERRQNRRNKREGKEARR